MTGNIIKKLRLRLAEGHTIRGVELGRQLSKTAGYVSRVIDQAEDAGLVVRKPDPDDRRAQLITLNSIPLFLNQRVRED